MFNEQDINEQIINPNEKEKDKMLKNTAEFRKALDEGRLEEAENFLKEVASNPDKFSQYDERWLDHRQRELFQSFCEIKDWTGAERVIEATKDSRSQEGRKTRLKELKKEKNYEEI